MTPLLARSAQGERQVDGVRRAEGDRVHSDMPNDYVICASTTQIGVLQA
jgi:hypothetical protein